MVSNMRLLLGQWAQLSMINFLLPMYRVSFLKGYFKFKWIFHTLQQNENVYFFNIQCTLRHYVIQDQHTRIYSDKILPVFDLTSTAYCPAATPGKGALTL